MYMNKYTLCSFKIFKYLFNPCFFTNKNNNGIPFCPTLPYSLNCLFYYTRLLMITNYKQENTILNE